MGEVGYRGASGEDAGLVDRVMACYRQQPSYIKIQNCIGRLQFCQPSRVAHCWLQLFFIPPLCPHAALPI